MDGGGFGVGSSVLRRIYNGEGQHLRGLEASQPRPRPAPETISRVVEIIT